MIRSLLLLLFAAVHVPAQAQAQAPVPASNSGSVTAEYYYRIKWGSAEEFKRLYKKNHAPILIEMQKQGFITRIDQEEPFTHLAGGPRWDLRITIVYRDPASAVGVGGVFDKAFAAAQKRLYPDESAFEAEEARRFSLLEEHWDVIVIPVSD